MRPINGSSPAGFDVPNSAQQRSVYPAVYIILAAACSLQSILTTLRHNRRRAWSSGWEVGPLQASEWITFQKHPNSNGIHIV